jgi:hypothetical protein
VRAPVRGRLAVLAAGLLFLSVSASARADAQITIVNSDAADEGFNDPTAATPVGGNTGTTVGQQRLLAFEHAAQIWEGLLDSSVEIRVHASFDALPCTATDGTLGGAFPSAVVSDPPNAPLAGVWYPVALANKFAGEDTEPAEDDINVRFNSEIGQPDCLPGTTWYYGLDAAHGNDYDLVAVLLHELGHGLGFLTLVDESTGEEFLETPDVFETMILDTETNKHWTDMTRAERAASAVNTGSVVFDGPAVRASVKEFLGSLPILYVDAPPAIAGDLVFGTADFGTEVGAVSLSGQVVQALDAADAGGPTTTDGCSPISNASEVDGKIALVDRGVCTFVQKATNAQAAGAIAMIVADNVFAFEPPGMGGTAPEIEIPCVSVTQADGNELKANLGDGVIVRIGSDPRRLAGAGSLNRPRLFAPIPAQPGSSISHWDTSAFPNLLMEPNLSADLPHEVDLTLPLFRDIGWIPDTFPPPEERAAPEAAERERPTRIEDDRP